MHPVILLSLFLSLSAFANPPSGSTAVNALTLDGDRIYAATDQGVWISTLGQDSFQQIQVAPGAEHGFIQTVYADGKTVIALSAYSGLNVSMDAGKSFVHYPDEPLSSILKAGNRYYLGALSNVYLVNPESLPRGSGIRKPILPSAQHHMIYRLIRRLTPQGQQIIAATDIGIVFIQDLPEPTYVIRNQKDGLKSDYINDVVARGSVVFAATDQGLSISRDGGVHFITLGQEAGLPSVRVRGVAVDGNRVYAATASGLAISENDGKTFQKVLPSQGLAEKDIYSVIAKNKMIYAGTAEGLYFSKDSKKFRLVEVRP